MSVTLAICITPYNQDKSIKYALESCIDQAENFDQIIVVDDCSQDSTFLIVKKIASKYSIPITTYQFSKNNGGPAWSRNLGLRLSKCQYTCFLDGDDIALRNRCSSLKEYLTFNKPDALVHGLISADILFSSKLIIPKRKLDTIHSKKIISTKYLLSSRACSPGSSLVLRSDIIKKIGFSEDKNIIGGEDREMLINLTYNNYSVCSLPKVLCLYKCNINKSNSSILNSQHLTSPANAINIVNYLKKKYSLIFDYNIKLEFETTLTANYIKLYGFVKGLSLLFSTKVYISFFVLINICIRYSVFFLSSHLIPFFLKPLYKKYINYNLKSYKIK